MRKLARLAGHVLKERKSVADNTKEAIASLHRGLFKQQLAVINDKSDYSVIVTSRQAGKSHTCAVDLLTQCLLFPESTAIYVALTRKSAKQILWRVLKKLVRDNKIPMPKDAFSETELSVKFMNGSVIYMAGGNDAAAMESLRGMPIDLCYFDESASYREITYAIEEVITPSFITKQGRLRLIGTPTSDLQSAFARAYLNPESEYSKHHWQTKDNIFIPHASKYVAKIMKKKGWTGDEPQFQREWCGIFAVSNEARVYSGYSPIRNLCDELPEGEWFFCLACDLGFCDANAYVVLAYNPEISRKVYVVEQFSQSKMLISDFGKKLQLVVQKYKPVAQVCDMGALGKAIGEEINSRFLGVNLKPANKLGKLAHIAMVNSAFSNGDLLIVDSEISPLAVELTELLWKDDSQLVENPKNNNHLTDSTTYGYMECYGYLNESIESEKQALQEHIKEQEAKGNWYNGQMLDDDRPRDAVEEIESWW